MGNGRIVARLLSWKELSCCLGEYLTRIAMELHPNSVCFQRKAKTLLCPQRKRVRNTGENYVL